MDDLTFRKRLLSNPNDQSEQIKAACQSDPAKAEFKKDQLAFDNKLNKALNIDVPDNLSERILLNQQLSVKAPLKRSWIWATAASVLLVSGISFHTFLAPQTTDQLVNHAIKHVQAELDHVPNEATLSLTDINSKLSDFGANITSNLENIKFASYCWFEGTRSLHLVMEDKGENVSVFVVPKNSGLAVQSSSSIGEYNGLSMSFDVADLVVVARDTNLINAWQRKLNRVINWQKA